MWGMEIKLQAPFNLWGDGKQTRSFMFIDDCVQGIQKIMDSDCEQPLNLGSDEMIDMNDFEISAVVRVEEPADQAHPRPRRR